MSTPPCAPASAAQNPAPLRLGFVLELGLEQLALFTDHEHDETEDEKPRA